MVHADNYPCLGALLRDALIQYKSETALIEVNRKNETKRLSYLHTRQEGFRVASHLASLGVEAGTHVAILMTNQSRWPIGAYAAMYRGAVLVPIDYKLQPHEQSALLLHAQPQVLLVEYSQWARLKNETLPKGITLLISEAPENAELPNNATRWEALPVPQQEPTFIERTRDDIACLVYSSGTGGRPKGCMLTHDNYLYQLGRLVDLYPMGIGDRFFSVLPTNHAIDFMVGFIGPLCGGATIVHQRALRPEFLRWTMQEYKVTHMALVPLLLEAFERAIQQRLDELKPLKRKAFNGLSSLNYALTQKRPNHAISKRLLKPIHEAFGGSLKYLFCGGAFVDKNRAEFFYRIGIPVAIGYGLTEVCTVATVNDLHPFRADSVGAPLPGIEVNIINPNPEGIGEVTIRGRTVMKGYLNEPELTAESIRDGWLHTGDLGWIDASGHLHLVGRSKNMIVTAGGKNIYPEDIELSFEGTPVSDFSVFSSSYIWPDTPLEEEKLVAVVRFDPEKEALAWQDLLKRNKALPDFKRVAEVLPWPQEFPRTASLKVKRQVLASQLRDKAKRQTLRPLA